MFFLLARGVGRRNIAGRKKRKEKKRKEKKRKRGNDAEEAEAKLGSIGEENVGASVDPFHSRYLVFFRNRACSAKLRVLVRYDTLVQNLSSRRTTPSSVCARASAIGRAG